MVTGCAIVTDKSLDPSHCKLSHTREGHLSYFPPSPCSFLCPLIVIQSSTKSVGSNIEGSTVGGRLVRLADGKVIPLVQIQSCQRNMIATEDPSEGVWGGLRMYKYGSLNFGVFMLSLTEITLVAFEW